MVMKLHCPVSLGLQQVISEKLTLAEIEAERDILEKCDHPNILPFIMDDQNGKNHYIFTELMEG